jgi:hypothetical protein
MKIMGCWHVPADHRVDLDGKTGMLSAEVPSVQALVARSFPTHRSPLAKTTAVFAPAISLDSDVPCKLRDRGGGLATPHSGLTATLPLP